MFFSHVAVGVVASLPSVAAVQVPLPEFEIPAASYRTQFRYWFPDASISANDVEKDIKAIADVGGGGLLFLPFYNFGFNEPQFVPWDEYGFGSPALRKLFVSALQSARENNLSVDFSIGANQGQGIPAKPATPGLAKQLVMSKTFIRGGESFRGDVPEVDNHYNMHFSELYQFMHHHEPWGESKLISVVAGGIKDSQPFDHPIHDLERNRIEVDFTDYILDEDSLIDLTDNIVDGKLQWDAPSDYDDYTIFAVYEQYTNQRSVDAPWENRIDILTNGSWITDHFSATGAQVTIDFWEEYMLDDEIRSLLKEVGRATWEDSMEMSSALWWSHEFFERFENNRGYSPRKYLPLMFHQTNTLRAEYPPYNETFVLDTETSGQSKYVQDYRLTLNEGYREYLQAIEKWSQSLGLEYTKQVAYNLPLDMAAGIPEVGLPETESLAFPNVDLLLQFTGSAHMSGRNVIASELGAVLTGAYSQSAKEILVYFNEGFAAGVNAMNIHGMAFGGETPSSWPGFTPVGYGFGESWGPRRPDWEHFSDTMNYVARAQLILRTGKPQRDIAFYHYAEPWIKADGYESDDLRGSGYTYEYLASANLASGNALVADGILAPDGPAYRALVFNNQDFISADAANKVKGFAEQGLPILIVGGLPSATIGSNGGEDVVQAFSSLESRDNVKIIGETDSVADALAREGVKPRVAIEATNNTDLWSFWRSTDAEDYVFFYNKGQRDMFKLTFHVRENQIPYKLDAWTGKQSEVVAFERSEDGLTISTELAAEQTIIYAFVTSDEAEKVHITSYSENIKAVERSQSGGYIVFIEDEKEASVVFSDSKEIAIPSSQNSSDIFMPITLGPWEARIESWTANRKSNDSKAYASVIEQLDLGTIEELEDWASVEGLKNVSGIGSYEASFLLPDTNHSVHNYSMVLDLGPILNIARLFVNGKQQVPVDPSNPVVDITECLCYGRNYVRIEVTSSLFNVVKANADWMNTLGQSPMWEDVYLVDPHSFGLVGPVTLRRLRKVPLLDGSAGHSETWFEHQVMEIATALLPILQI